MFIKVNRITNDYTLSVSASPRRLGVWSSSGGSASAMVCGGCVWVRRLGVFNGLSVSEMYSEMEKTGGVDMCLAR